MLVSKNEFLEIDVEIIDLSCSLLFTRNLMSLLLCNLLSLVIFNFLGCKFYTRNVRRAIVLFVFIVILKATPTKILCGLY
jgi:hypothetical protein